MKSKNSFNERKVVKPTQNHEYGLDTVDIPLSPGMIPLCALVRACSTSNATPHTESQDALSTVEQAKRRTDSKTPHTCSLPAVSMAIEGGGMRGN